MCITSPSESGHGGRFEPCEECKRLQEENEFTGNRVDLLEAENAALRQERDRLAGIVHTCMATLGMTQTAWEGTNIPRGEDDLPRWVRDVSQATYKKGLALKKADALAEAVKTRCSACSPHSVCEMCICGLSDVRIAAKAYQEARNG